MLSINAILPFNSLETYPFFYQMHIMKILRTMILSLFKHNAHKKFFV